MARISKKERKAEQALSTQITVWNAGIYARLSVDSDDQKNESIDTQIEIAKEYIRRSGDIELSGCYTDLGKTGTNFEREGFEQMMADVRRRKINCIIVKDFSRFGRNYIETGNYIEKIFPFFHVRFIAVSDGYDSHQNQGANDTLAIHLKNIVNELYARDCAEKVRAIKKSKLEQGSYVGGIPCYGYCAKWVNGKKILFPEEGTSDVVRKIYELYDGGYRINEIISYLYAHHIHRPKEYQSTGHVCCGDGEILKQWSDCTIRTMLTNYVYIGTLVQIRIDGKTCRGKGRQDIEPDQVVMVEHTHEPIIEEDMFYRISSRIAEKLREALQQKKLPEDAQIEDIYKDLIYCGECGHRLKRICTSNSRSYGASVRTYSYGCPNIGRIDGMKCENHFLTLNALNRIVMETLQKEFDLSGIHAKTFIDFNRKEAERRMENASRREEGILEQIQEIEIEMSSLYMQYRTEKIDKHAFLERKAEKEAGKSSLAKEIARLRDDELRIEKEASEINHFIRCLWKGKEETVPDAELIHCLIQKITVYSDRRVEVIFRFSKKQFENYKKEACGR